MELSTIQMPKEKAKAALEEYRAAQGCACRCICHLHHGRPIHCRNASRAGSQWCYACAATTGCRRK